MHFFFKWVCSSTGRLNYTFIFSMAKIIVIFFLCMCVFLHHFVLSKSKILKYTLTYAENVSINVYSTNCFVVFISRKKLNKLFSLITFCKILEMSQSVASKMYRGGCCIDFFILFETLVLNEIH